MATMCKELKNVGASECAFPLKVARRLNFVPLYGHDGTKNSMSLDPTADDYIGKRSAWDLKVSPTDPLATPLDMFYPLPVMENVTDERGDTEFFEWDSKLKVRIQQGVRTFIGLIPNEWPSLLGKLQAWEGQKFGVYIIDKKGAIVFNYGTDSAGEVRAYPIPVDGNSLDAKLIKATYTDPGSIMVQFDFDADVNDKDLYLLGLDKLDFDPRTEIKALTDLYITSDDWSDPTFVLLTLSLDYGVPAAGFAQIYFLVRDEGGIEVTLTDPGGFVESPDGTYKLTFDALTSQAGWTVYIAPETYTAVKATYNV